MISEVSELVTLKSINCTIIINKAKNTRKIRINRDGGHERFANPLKTSTTTMEDDSDDDDE